MTKKEIMKVIDKLIDDLKTMRSKTVQLQEQMKKIESNKIQYKRVDK